MIFERVVRWGICAFVVSSVSGCFYYDSRWGQAKAEQRRVAAVRTPRLVHSRAAEDGVPVASHPKAIRKLRVRVLATPAYAASVFDWQRQAGTTFSDANAVLEQDFGVSLELADARVWAGVSSEHSLPELLKRLTAEHPGTDVDYVLGLATSVPGLAHSPDQLGVARVLGKHLVMRAMSDAEEFDAIKRAFSELSEDEQHKLYGARKRHKTASVLLHELGHTLGMPHEAARETLMHAHFSTDVSTFSKSAVELGRLTLARRAEQPAAANTANSAKPAPAPNSASAKRTSSSPDLVELTSEDQKLFVAAEELKSAGKVNEAYAAAQPLFMKYLKVFAVQNLRCELAMASSHNWANAESECRELAKLLPGFAPSTK
jgi:hypothetical protein